MQHQLLKQAKMKRGGKRRIPYYLKKSKNEKRVSNVLRPIVFLYLQRIIQKPWSKPMAAQHLAAIKIQNLVRRFLYKKRRLERGIRGGHHHNRHFKKQILGGSNRVMKGVNVQGGAKFSNVSELQHLTATQKLRSKFFTSPFNVLHKSEEQCWRNFCAALIQATYKMALTRRLFKYHRFAMYHIAAIQIQWAWRGYFQRKRKVPQKSREVIAVEKI